MEGREGANTPGNANCRKKKLPESSEKQPADGHIHTTASKLTEVSASGSPRTPNSRSDEGKRLPYSVRKV